MLARQPAIGFRQLLNDENIAFDIDIDWGDPDFDVAPATFNNVRLQPRTSSRAPFADITNQTLVVQMQEPAELANIAAPPERLLMTTADWVSYYL